MRHAGSALLAVLLASSAAHATVYVWQDRAGALVLTNVASELRDAPRGPLVTYATSETPADGGPAVQGTHGATDGGAAAARKDVARSPGGTPPDGDATADVERNPPASPGTASGASHTLGEDGAQQRSAAATTPRDRPVIEPRALLEVAADAAPPRVIVSIVGSSTSPLSTSDRATSLASGGPDGSRGEPRSGGAATLAGALSQAAERVAGGMR